MADVFTKAKRSEVMSKIRSRGNRDTELRMISIFREHKIRGWRRNASLPGRPDFVFRSNRLILFIDGCFWHGCPKHFHLPKSHQDYWNNKIFRNKRRDRQVNTMIRQLGWNVMRIWEHALTAKHSLATANRIKKRLATLTPEISAKSTERKPKRSKK